MENWLINPLNNALAQPVVLWLGAIFGSFGLLLLGLSFARQTVTAGAGTAANFAGTPLPVLWQRYRTWAIIAVLVSGAVLGGLLPLALLCAFLSWQAGREYALLTNLPAGQRTILIGGNWLTLLAILINPANITIAPAVAFFGWAGLALRPQPNETTAGERFAPMVNGLWGYLYTGWLPAHLLALAAGLNNGTGLVLVVALGVALSDVGAFCAGKTFGGPKLAPRLSPNKTWGGALGNLLGAGLALVLFNFALPAFPCWKMAALAVVLGLSSLWGDLLESLLKRQRGVKDAGGLLPGFGGLLDRVDSLLLAAPLVYYLFLLLDRLTV